MSGYNSRVTISSHIPGGHFNRCPICDMPIRIEVSEPMGDANCPACSAPIWFRDTELGLQLFDPKDPSFRDWIRAILVNRLGVEPGAVTFNDNGSISIDGFDSLDLTELLLELDEEMGNGE